MTSRPNVVITGVGVVSPIGIGHDAYWESLCAGRCGVRRLPELAATAWPVPLGAPVVDFEPKQYVKPRKALKVMSREIQMGFSAAVLAAEHAGLSSEQVEPDRFGVLFGGEMLYCDPQEMVAVYRRCIDDGTFHFEKWGNAAMSTMYPLWMLMFLPNMIACHIGIAQDARGPNNTICAGEASGLLAVMEAAHILQRGDADAMIAGASSSRISLTPMVYRGADNLTRRSGDPAGAVRPFDADRDGTVNGEGGAAIILETEDHAARRGARVLARLAGWHSSFGSSQDPAAYQAAMLRSVHGAIDSTSLSPREVDHVNAHAAGTVPGDALEAHAIRKALGDVPVTAPKSYFGSLGPAGSVMELAVSLLSITHGSVPPTLNYETPDPQCPVRVIHQQARAVDGPAALVLSYSSTGQTCAVVLSAP